MFISFEGLDFCGKSTQVKLLTEYLKRKTDKVEVIREPGGTEISEKIRDILLDKNHSKMTIETELLLFSASRSQLVEEVILPKLKSGYYIISDRFHDSSIAYQGYGRGIDLDFVMNLQKFVIKNAVPDLTFFIDIPVEEVIKRKLNQLDKEPDRIESSESNFYENVRKGYWQLFEKENRFRKIDGMKSINEIHEIIINELKIFEFKRSEKQDV